MGFENVRKAKVAGNTEALSKMGAAGGRQAAENGRRIKVRALDEAAAIEIKILEEEMERADSGNERTVPIDSSDDELDK